MRLVDRGIRRRAAFSCRSTAAVEPRVVILGAELLLESEGLTLLSRSCHSRSSRGAPRRAQIVQPAIDRAVRGAWPGRRVGSRSSNSRRPRQPQARGNARSALARRAPSSGSRILARSSASRKAGRPAWVRSSQRIILATADLGLGGDLGASPTGSCRPRQTLLIDLCRGPTASRRRARHGDEGENDQQETVAERLRQADP